MILRPLSAERAAVAQRNSTGAVAMYTLLPRRCYKGKRLVTSSSAVPIYCPNFFWAERMMTTIVMVTTIVTEHITQRTSCPFCWPSSRLSSRHQALQQAAPAYGTAGECPWQTHNESPTEGRGRERECVSERKRERERDRQTDRQTKRSNWRRASGPKRLTTITNNGGFVLPRGRDKFLNCFSSAFSPD